MHFISSTPLVFFLTITDYPAVYGQFSQAIPQPVASVGPTQREGNSDYI